MIHQLGGVLALLIVIVAAFVISLLFIVDFLITILEHLQNKRDRRNRKRRNEEDR